MGDYWTIHQILKPILGPSSSHSSAPLVMGFIFRGIANIHGFDINMDSLKKSMKINIYCHNPSKEMYAFIGHRSIRAFLFGALGAYFSFSRRQEFFDIKKSLEGIREYDLLHSLDISFRMLSESDVAYRVEVIYDDIRIIFDSLGGGIISVEASDDARKVVETLMGESIPIWLYLSYESLENLGIKLTFDKKAIEEGKEFLDNADEILMKKVKGESIGSYISRRENSVIGGSLKIMEEIWQIMYESTNSPPEVLRYSKFLKYEIAKVKLESNDLPTRVLRYALNVAAKNAEMNIIISAPTGGASSIFPATMRVALEEFNLNKEEILNGLYVGGLIGGIIGNNMSVSGSRHGCQAEVGTSLAMASAAIVDMLLDTEKGEERNKMVFDAASIALQSIQGLACDPLMGFVEVPCVLRNLAFVGIPFVVARMVSAGYRPIITLRTAIKALRKTGELLNKALRESGTGPITCMYILSRMEERGIEEELVSLFEKEMYW